jgi:translation initiation factor 3 subunit D
MPAFTGRARTECRRILYVDVRLTGRRGEAKSTSQIEARRPDGGSRRLIAHRIKQREAGLKPYSYSNIIMVTFSVPFVQINNSSWGPPSASTSSCAGSIGSESDVGPKSKFHNLPYAPFGRSDRLGKVADFTQPGFGSAAQQQQMQQQRGRQSYFDQRNRWSSGADNNEGFQYRVDPNEDNFLLVDTTKSSSSQKKFVLPASKRRQQRASSLRQLNARRNAAGAAMDSTRFHPRSSAYARRRGGAHAAPQWGRGGGGPMGGRGARTGWRDRMDRQASVSVKADWVVLDEFELNKLAKLKLEGTMPKEKDVLWCGFVDQYNEAYDKISTKVRFYDSPAVHKQSVHRKKAHHFSLMHPNISLSLLPIFRIVFP